MKVRELTAQHIGAPASVDVDGETITGTLVGFGWGGIEGQTPTEARLDLYGGTSATVSLQAEIIVG